MAEDNTNILNLLDGILVPADDLSDFKVKLRLFMQQFFGYLVSNRELILIVSRDVSSKHALDAISSISEKIPQKIVAFFSDAKKKKIIKDGIDPVVLSDIIVQPYFLLTLFSDLQKNLHQKDVTDPSFRSCYIDQQLSLLLSGILVR